MLPLLKIRIKSIKPHLASYIIFYIIIPLVFLLISIYLKSNSKFKENVKIIPKIDSSIQGEYTLFQEDKQKQYSKLVYYLDELSIISKDINECNSFAQFMKNETYDNSILKMEKSDFKCYQNEKDLPPDEDAIVIIKNGEKYEFQLFKHNRFIMFENKILSTYNSINLFNVESTEEKSYKQTYQLFLDFQSLISKYLIKKKLGDSFENTFKNKNMKITIGNNAYPEHTNFYDLGQKNKNIILNFCFMSISLLFSIYTYFFCIRMIEEKEKQLDLCLIRYGSSEISYFLSWLIPFLVVNLPFIISLYILSSTYLPFHSLLFLINIILYVLSLFSSSYFFYVCIPSTSAGYTILKLFYFGLSAFGIAMTLTQTSKSVKIIFGFIPQINIYNSLYAIYELQTLLGLSWNIINLNNNKISFLESIIIYMVDIIFYSILSLLINTLKNSKFFHSIFKQKLNLNDNENLLLNNIEPQYQTLSPENQKRKEQNDCLKILNLNQKYGDLKIINNFNGEFFPNEIFCLLGNNGAGKTTLFNIISGIMNPSEGDITYNGISLISNKSYLYQKISICPQENILFEYLTVLEHLELFQDLKLKKINHDEINNLIKELDLLDKENTPCGELSYGQKRKLSIALSLIGNSQIILLDEPTSGMDPISKKTFWKLLKNNKNDKIIILTTHSFEEAENLGDRIGFLLDANFICYGNPSFLKEKYPCGITINILLSKSKDKIDENKQKIINQIKQYDKDVTIGLSLNKVLSLNTKLDNKNMNDIFGFLEKSKEELGIEDYFLRTTSLEDIFLKINNKENKDDSAFKNRGNEENFENINVNDNFDMTKGFFSQLSSEIKRYFFPLKRNYIFFILEFIISLFTIYLFIFVFFYKWTLELTKQKKNLDLIKVLETNINYIFDENNYIKNSYIFDISNKLELKKIEQKPKNITDFMEYIYQISSANIAKGSVYIEKNDTSNKTIYEVYNTEIFTGNYGNVFANNMLCVSAFLKTEYNIDALVLTKISFEYKNVKKINFFQIIEEIINSMIIEVFALFGYLLYLAYLTREKINERKNNIKRLLYLSGRNLWSYWISFLLMDLCKIIIFSILLMMPVTYINGSGTYIFFNILFSSIPSLIFIYIISFLCITEDSFIKFILIYFMVIFGFNSFLRKYNLEKGLFVNIESKSFIFTSFDLNPITSMAFSWIRIIFHYCNRTVYTSVKFLKPVTISLLNSLVIQIFNLIFYGIIFLLTEGGYIKRFFNYLKIKIFLKEKNIKNNDNDDFYIDNDIGGLLSINKTLTEEIITKDKLGVSMGSINEDEEEVNIKLDDDNNIINANNNIMKRTSRLYSDPMINQYVLNEVDKIRNSGGHLIKIEGVKKSFWYCCKKKVKVINNLFLGLQQNEKFGLLGFNGSGKSVTIKMIINEILYDTGEITLFQYNNRSQMNKINSKIGYCPEENLLFENMKVKEIIQFFINIKNSGEIMNVENISEKFGLNRYLECLYSTLSRGNKRKLFIAISLMNKADILLLDEPFISLDINSKRMTWNNIEKLTNKKQRYNMILSNQSLDEADILCDRISWFKKGNFSYIGKSDILKENNNLKYKLSIKLDNSKFYKEEMVSTNKIEESFKLICDLVNNFNQYREYFNANPKYEPDLVELYNIINQFKNDIKSIEFNEMGINNSYSFTLEIIKEQRTDLYCKIIELKIMNNKISEISIQKESLENILFFSK